jgi:hypothetical protein
MDIAVQERPRQFEFLPIAESVSGRHRVVEIINANTSGTIGSSIFYHDNIVISGTIGALTPVFITGVAYDTCWMTISTASVSEEYKPELVKRVLDADAKPPVARFSNVIDMLEWLDRE